MKKEEPGISDAEVTFIRNKTNYDYESGHLPMIGRAVAVFDET